MGAVIQKDSLWQAVLGEIELSVSHGNFITWFKNTCLLKSEDDSVVIGVQNVFVKQQLESKYTPLITEVLEKNGVTAETIEYKISPLAAGPSRDAGSTTNEEESDNDLVEAPMVTTPSRPAPQALNERYTFDNFVVGDANEIAFAACQGIASSPGTRYNPLYLYGGVGIGKTHLIQAVGNFIAEHNPGAKILYISTEQFVQEFVKALQQRKTADFANHYRTADVLIVDDIQFIAGKEKMQEEFFHTFNTLHQANKQIIISSDKLPKDIPTLEERLRSRFAGGMCIDMQIPDFETRCAIVQTKAQNQGVELEPDVVDYLASNIQTNIRELEGALNQLLAFCEVRNLDPTVAIASSMLTLNKARPKHLSAKQIIERTARHFQVPLEDVLGPKRDKDIVVPRQIAMYLLRSELHLSFPKIARELGRKDHTTAIHSVAKIEEDARQDASIRMAIADIKEHLYA
ncbi:MAG TPA: chromosomal replication initiator protein DnaA [Candidatus Saccharimonadales bacterium]|nr:chromosomal replication initiator protein DnaA [Candidatus Saccharimonadales bacterium]